MNVYKETIKAAKAKAKEKVKLEKLAAEEVHGTATIVDGVDTTITTYTTDKEINILHNAAKQKLAKQM